MLPVRITVPVLVLVRAMVPVPEAMLEPAVLEVPVPVKARLLMVKLLSSVVARPVPAMVSVRPVPLDSER